MIFGLLNYHRAFIPDFAKKAAAIPRTYGSKGRFVWTTEADMAFESLKHKITTSAMKLQIPCMKTAKFVLKTDACDSGFAGTLFICNDEKPHQNTEQPAFGK